MPQKPISQKVSVESFYPSLSLDGSPLFDDFVAKSQNDDQKKWDKKNNFSQKGIDLLDESLIANPNNFDALKTQNFAQSNFAKNPLSAILNLFGTGNAGGGLSSIFSNIFNNQNSSLAPAISALMSNLGLQNGIGGLGDLLKNFGAKNDGSNSTVANILENLLQKKPDSTQSAGSKKIKDFVEVDEK